MFALIPVAYAATIIQCPDVSLMKGTEVSDAGKLICIAERDTFDAIQEALRVLNYDKSSTEKLHINNCDRNSSTWVKAATTSTVVQKTYSFKNGCDLSGTFTGGFLEPFDLNLEMRRLSGFNRLRLKVKLRMRQKPNGILYSFSVTEGMIGSPEKVVHFNVEYSVLVDPLTGKTKYRTQEGEITLTGLGERNLSLTRALVFTP